MSSKSSSSSSSDESKPRCAKPCCADLPCDFLSGYEVFCQKQAAVVDVQSQFILTNTPANTQITDATTNLTTYTVSGNGVFINKHYILTHSSLAQINPAFLVDNVRWPFRNATDGVGTAPVVGNGLEPEEIVKMSRILVTVHKLNGRHSPTRHTKKCRKEDMYDGWSVVYSCKVLLVDGAGGFALLYIDPCDPWNQCQPAIKKKCHPKLCLGSSRKLHRGDDVYLLGNLTGSVPLPYGYNNYLGKSLGSFGISKGVVSDHRYVDHSGWVLPELVLVDCSAHSPALGAPLLNKFGQLVGIQALGTSATTFVGVTGVNGGVGGALDFGPRVPSVGNGKVACISEFFMRDGIAAVLELSRKGNCGRNRLLDHLGSVADLTGPYYKFLKGYMGIAYELVEPTDFDTYLTPNGQSGVRPGERNVVINSNLSIYNGPSYKTLNGVRVNTLATSTGGGASYQGNPVVYLQVPGTGCAAPFNPAVHADSGYLNVLTPESVIVALKGDVVLGDESEQVAPSLLTWRMLDGDPLNLTVKQPAVTTATGIVTDTSHLNNLSSVSAELGVFPPTYDYFWSAVSCLPEIGAPVQPTLTSYNWMFTTRFSDFKPTV